MLVESVNQFSLEELCRTTQCSLNYFFRSHIDHQTYGKTLKQGPGKIAIHPQENDFWWKASTIWLFTSVLKFLVDLRSLMAHVAKFSGQLWLNRSILRISKFPVLKLLLNLRVPEFSKGQLTPSLLAASHSDTFFQALHLLEDHWWRQNTQNEGMAHVNFISHKTVYTHVHLRRILILIWF